MWKNWLFANTRRSHSRRSVRDRGSSIQEYWFFALVAVALGTMQIASAQSEHEVVRLDIPVVPVSDVEDFQVTADSSTVVFRGDFDLNERIDLYSTPADGSGSPIKLTESLAVDHDVSSFDLSPDSIWVVYKSYQDLYGMQELYSARADGSISPIKLHTPLSADQDIEDFAISPDSTSVVYIRSDNAGMKLFSVPIDGSASPVELSGTLVPGGGVHGFKISNDSTRVVYEAIKDAVDVTELYTVPIDGSAPSVKLNNALTPGGNVEFFRISADSSRVVYRADQNTVGAKELFSVPITGGTPAVVLNSPLPPGGSVIQFVISENSQWVVYMADEAVDGVVELFSVPITGGASPERLNGAFTADRDVTDFEISDAFNRVVYVADESTNGLFELFSAPIDGSAPAIKLNHAFATGDVDPFKLSNDGSRVVYRVTRSADEPFEVYSVAVDRMFEPVKLLDGIEPPVPDYYYPGPEFDNSRFAISPDSGSVIFVTDAETSGRNELFSIPIDAGLPLQKVSSIFISDFVVLPDSSRVVYIADQNRYRVIDIFSAPIDGSAPGVMLSQMGLNGGGTSGTVLNSDQTFIAFNSKNFAGSVDIFSARTDGTGSLINLANTSGSVTFSNLRIKSVSSGQDHVIFRARSNLSEFYEYFSVPFDGSGPAIMITDPSEDESIGTAVISPDGQWLVYKSDVDVEDDYELYVVPMTGGASAIRLSGPSSGRGVEEFEITPDSSRVLYLKNQALGATELFSVPIDRSSPATTLNPPFARTASGVKTHTDQVKVFELSPDGSRVVFTADVNERDKFEAYSAPTDGSAAAVRLHYPLETEHDVGISGISPDGSTVVYWSGQRFENIGQLYSVPIDRSTPPVRLTNIPENIGQAFGGKITPDGSHVLFVAGRVLGIVQLYSTPLDGSAFETKLSRRTQTSINSHDSLVFRISPDSKYVVYSEEESKPRVFELFSVPVDGSKARVKLNATLPTGGSVEAGKGTRNVFQISSDSSRVVYVADQDTVDVLELYSVPIDRSKAPIKLNPPLVSGGNVMTFGAHSNSSLAIEITGNNERVLYRADQFIDDEVHIFTVPLTGGVASQRSSGPIHSFEDIYAMPYRDIVVYNIRMTGDSDGLFTSVKAGPQVTVSYAASKSAIVSSFPVRFDVEFSEPVTGFDAFDGDDADVVFPGVPSVSYSVSDLGSGSFRVNVTDAPTEATLTPKVPAGVALGITRMNQGSVYVGETVVYDVRGPRPTIVSMVEEVISAGQARFSVSYNDLLTVSGIDIQPSDVSVLSTGSVSFSNVTIETGNPLKPEVCVNGLSGEGTLRIQLADGTAVDAAGNLAEPSLSPLAIVSPSTDVASSSYSSDGRALAIPNPGTVVSTLSVPNVVLIRDIDVTINITHTAVGDLVVWLQSPLGTKIPLFTNLGTGGANFIGTTLDDESLQSIGSGAAPFTGRFQPEGVLGVFDGELARGDWKLIVEDNRVGNFGRLLSWSLAIEHIEAFVMEPVLDINGAELKLISVPVITSDSSASLWMTDAPEGMTFTDQGNGSGLIHWIPYYFDSGHHADIKISASNGSKQISDTFDVTVLDTIASVPLRWGSAALILIAILGSLVVITMRRRHQPPTS